MVKIKMKLERGKGRTKEWTRKKLVGKSEEEGRMGKGSRELKRNKGKQSVYPKIY